MFGKPTVYYLIIIQYKSKQKVILAVTFDI